LQSHAAYAVTKIRSVSHMRTRNDQSELLVCTSCGRRAEPRQHICEHCGAPITPYAHSDPVMGIMARGFAAHKATTDPQKPIVVLGMWLWMVPGFFAGLYMTTLGIGFLLEGVGNHEWLGLIGIPVLGIGLVMVWIAGGILLKTTLRYLESSERGDQTEEREETV